MSPLLDILGPTARCSAIKGALARLARQRGAASTPPAVVNALLDLAGHTPDRPLYRRRLLEPAFGRGEVLLAAIERLLASYSLAGGQASEAVHALRDAIRAVELHVAGHDAAARAVEARLIAAGLSERDAHRLRTIWLVRDDFLLCHLNGEFDCVVGHPPQTRLERLPSVLRREYRRRFHTLYDRADVSIAFFERALDRLAPAGRLGFVGSSRWLKNKSGGPLRTKIALEFALTHFIDLEGLEAFTSNGIAESALMFIERPPVEFHDAVSGCTRLVKPGVLSLPEQLPYLVTALGAESLDEALLAEVRLGGARRDAPWLLDGGEHLDLIHRFEHAYPTLNEAGCQIGHGVATGCDRVFIDDYPSLPVESACKLPLIMARDLVDGEIQWHGQGVINPFQPDGRLVDLDEHPRLADYLERHRAAIAGRHVARRNPTAWYRTIDRIDPSLVGQPKLLMADVKGETKVVFDEGHFYPHHSLCYVTTSEWEPRALQAVLCSSVAVAMIATYGTRSAGGSTRLQASSLRRLRIPRWAEVSETQRTELAAVALDGDRDAIDEAVFRLYGLDGREAEYIRAMARWH
ncbi:Eco57I restriction-modification methylase domain-containing protein [Allochromatium vinosum]|uniref:site-specific DNA-methyltransferase (adenine-specific) n=1 Tax=Allochromatium vinosum (strain ATCC 17899 / DSM 180 / NBRC 103801 / NCIMB 10441 / D) TaxID=572477 RepID=D3RPB4_ALLVD|nr:Eco57I restriction-modification methylase domain-containing protein [Allochromatium vinosum]ADC63504.1 modification methylase [Allochromatium vinosum DSM 180]